MMQVRTTIALVLLLVCARAPAIDKMQLLSGHHVPTLEQVQSSGELRVLMLRTPEQPEGLRQLAIADRQLAGDLAQHLGVRLHVIEVDEYAQLFSQLKAGRADLIAEPYPTNTAHLSGLRASLPLHDAAPVLIGDQDLPWTVTVNAPGWHWALARRQQASERDLKVQTRTQAVARLLPSTQTQDALVSNSRIADALQLDARAMGPAVPYSWMARDNDRMLLAQVDDFLQRHQLKPDHATRPAGDWQAIKAQGVLRMVTVMRAETYFPWQGQLLGFDYEMVQHFARQHQLELEVMVAPDADTAVVWLQAGLADLAAAFLNENLLSGKQGVVASVPYHETAGVLVGTSRSPVVINPMDLNGRKILLPADSRYREQFDRWMANGIRVGVVDLPPNQITDTVVARLERGDADYAVLDAHLAHLKTAWGQDLAALLPIGDAEAHVWAVPEGADTLLGHVNAYWQATRGSYRYDLTWLKYFSPGRSPDRFLENYMAFVQDGAISPFDSLVRRHAARHDIDWRLVVAQMYQESRFDPAAVSRAGAEGLMQLKPATAGDLGVRNSFDPEENIEGGVRYLSWLRDRFESDLPITDRLWFSLAAYNGGLRHIQTARELARAKGLNDRRWFGHVEQAVIELARIGVDGGKGYLDAEQVTDYVRSIRQRFNAYQMLTDQQISTVALARSVERAPDHSAVQKDDVFKPAVTGITE
ncbi:MAG: hypothetical protein DHS20C11_34150 [Lysobacteraceae bacterium]|nr:MAG: hypothetical protein DHS20C11_34150 [Xanthomonadaceae bacterium]